MALLHARPGETLAPGETRLVKCRRPMCHSNHALASSQVFSYLNDQGMVISPFPSSAEVVARLSTLVPHRWIHTRQYIRVISKLTFCSNNGSDGSDVKMRPHSVQNLSSHRQPIMTEALRRCATLVARRLNSQSATAPLLKEDGHVVATWKSLADISRLQVHDQSHEATRKSSVDTYQY